MAASYPSATKVFTTKSNNTTADASHINDLQLEVTAIEQDLIAGLPVGRGGTGLTAIGAASRVLASNGSTAEWVVPLSAYPCDLRLTLTSGTPVTTSDVTAATTMYLTPFRGNRLALYSGTAWVGFSQAELSIAVPATTNQMYDVFVDYNSGTPQLSLTAWTNDTTRATALTTQDGVYVKTGATGSRYVGSFRTTGVSGQTEDSLTKRFVWNYYNRVRRPMQRIETTATWNYTSQTVRQANGSTANQLAVVIGVAETMVEVDLLAVGSNSSAGQGIWAGIGVNSTTTFSGTLAYVSAPAAGYIAALPAHLTHQPAAGYTFYSWNESNDAGGTVTYRGQATAASGRMEPGISGSVEC